MECGEELCIFYGHRPWFRPMVGSVSRTSSNMADEENEDGWGGLLMVDGQMANADAHAEGGGPFLDGDPDEIVPEDELPFTRLKITPDDIEEEEPDAIRTVQAWVVDIPDPRNIATALKWLRQSGLDSELGHLKRVRRRGEASTLLLRTSAAPPELPHDLGLPAPYLHPVPLTAALTITSVKLKTSLWPTVYAPRRTDDAEAWSRGKARWAWDAMRAVLQAATDARSKGELPIVAHVPSPYGNEDQLPISFSAHDTRTSTAHPLRHAVLNVARQVADYRASKSFPALSAEPTSSITAAPELQPSTDGSRNGTHYLLTSLTLFTSHEPCIMCSMALLHSRVKEVFYLFPMSKTGGCGGATCLSKLEGVNHRYGISRWNVGIGDFKWADLEVNEVIDA